MNFNFIVKINEMIVIQVTQYIKGSPKVTPYPFIWKMCIGILENGEIIRDQPLEGRRTHIVIII